MKGLLRRAMLVGISVALAGAADARADTLECGDVVTSSVTLDRSLTGCSNGLVVDADGVTIDLNGHSIEGVSRLSGLGIAAEGRNEITIRNGSIRGFNRGVLLYDTSSSHVTELDIQDVGLGISLTDSRDARITANTISNSGGGIEGFFGRFHVIEDNLVTRNGFGIDFVRTYASSLSRNVVTDNAAGGISLDLADTDFRRNVVNANGTHGIRARDSHGTYVGNVTNANGGSGLSISDDFPHGSSFTVAHHTANANGSWGIRVFPGVIDGGRNLARANGEPRQCENLVCNRNGPAV